MKLEHRCFSGKSFRPQPEILIKDTLQIFSIITPWGPVSQAKKTLDFISQNYEDFSSDEEKTNVYEKLASLSKEENILRTLILSCNEWIYNKQNSSGHEYIYGYEMVCGSFQNGKLIFVQVGQPFIYLDRPGLPLQPLGHVLDLSSLFSKKNKRFPPLPSTLLGIHPDSHFFVFSLPVKPSDRLIFISRDFAPDSILDIPRDKRGTDRILSVLMEENDNAPAWLGILSF